MATSNPIDTRPDAWERYGVTSSDDAAETARRALEQAADALAASMPLVLRFAVPANRAGRELADTIEDDGELAELSGRVSDMLAVIGVAAGRASGWTETFVPAADYGRMLSEHDPDGPHAWPSA